MKHIGPNLRRLRQAAGLTQGQLAEKADVADATISRVERNRLEPSGTLITKLAAALRVKADDLLGPAKDLPKQRVRSSIAKLIAVVEEIDDAGVDDIRRAVMLTLGVGRRLARTRR